MGEAQTLVLLVEDDEAHAELVRRAFQAQGASARLEVTATVHAARARLAAGPPPDLLLADWRLPDGEGVELLTEARARIPVILMTSRGSEAMAVAAMKAGALDYIVKSDASLLDMPHMAERALREWRSMAERRRVEQELRESEARWHFALEGNGDGVWDYDARTGKAYRSRQWKAMLGYAPEEIGDSPEDIWRLLHPEDRDRVMAGIAHFLAGRDDAFASEFRLHCKDGSYKWILDRGQVVERGPDGTLLRAIGVHSDITRRKESENELAGYRARLEDLVRERTAELEMAQEELFKRKHLAMLGRLTAVISHEIRNPLGIVRAALFAAREAIERSDGDGARNALATANTHVGRCGDIITRLLDATRRRSMAPMATDIDAWLAAVLDEIEVPAGSRCELSLACGMTLDVDREDLRRAVTNIVENGYQAMQEKEPSGGSLHVATRTGGGRLEMVFTDEGPGIPLELREKVFEPLFSTKSMGVGLGLSIVRAIMESHGGGIDLGGVPGTGATVTLWMPLP